MNFVFNDGKSDFNVWLSSFSDTATVNSSYKRGIRTDDNGRFFTWNKKKFYLDDFKKIHINQIKEKINKKEWFSDDELCQAIICTGVDNVKFNVPMSVVDFSVMGLTLANPSKTITKKCHIVESFGKMVHDGYKLDLYVDNYDGSTVRHESYYTLDLVGLLRSGHITIE